jgi:hypothetical protein
MRKLWTAALCLAAAGCGGGGEEKKEGPPALLPAGTWQVSSEVSSIRATERRAGAVPAVSTKVGDKENATVCVDKPAKEPPAALFAGSGETCTYKNAYIKEGTINAALDCRREDLPGSILINVQGTYTAKGFEGRTDTMAWLTVPGAYQMSRKISGTVKPGACTPAPATADGDDGNESAD